MWHRRPLGWPFRDETASLRLGVAQLLDPLLHLVELALEIVDLAAGGGRRLLGFGICRLAPRERLEHFHVPPHLVFEWGERTGAEGVAQLVAEFLLFAGQRFDRYFEVSRHQHL